MSKKNALKTGWEMLKSAYNYTPDFLKGGAKSGKVTKALEKKFGAKNLKRGKWGVAGAIGLGSLLGDSGPDADETTQRAMNQLRYGADMTDDQLEEAKANGQTFRDTGIIGENGLNEEEARAYIAQNADQRGAAERIGGSVVDALSWVPGYGQAVAAIGGTEYERRLGNARNLNLQNIVGKLKADANEGNIRRNMEGTMGKFMAEGLLDKEFGRGKVRTQGGVKPAPDREQEAALKEYEAIKARDGVHAALASPSALKAGRQVYLDVQEASGGDKNTAEALLSGVGGQEGVGLTDQETMQKYYGDPEKNALSNEATAAKAALAAAQQQTKREEEARIASGFTQEARAEATSGPMDIKPAQNPEQLRLNREMINASKGWHGESIEGEKQRAYLEDRGMSTARGMGQRLEAAADLAYEQKHGFGRYSPQAYNLSLANHAKAMSNAQEEYRKRRAMLAEQEYSKHIVKPGDKDYRVDTASAAIDAASGKGSEPAPGFAPTPEQVKAAADGIGPDKVVPTPIKVPSGGVREGPPPLPPQRMPAPEPAPSNVMKPTPYGVGTATPGFPKLPDIGAPARNAGERIGNLILGANAPGNPAPNMKPTPYGLGSGTAGMPQVPDIGAPVRNAVEGALTTQSSAPGQMPKGPMNQAEIAKMIAEQKRKEIEARNAQMPRNPGKTRPNPMKPLY